MPRTHLQDLEGVLHEGIRTVHEAETPRFCGVGTFAHATFAVPHAGTEQDAEQCTAHAFHGFTSMTISDREGKKSEFGHRTSMARGMQCRERLSDPITSATKCG
jgi:hypothetical protein